MFKKLNLRKIDVSIIDNMVIVETDTKRIFIESDLCHWISEKSENYELEIHKKRLKENNTFGYYMDIITIDNFDEISEEIDITDFCEYWGIKDRVYRNLQVLKETFEELNINYTFPEWKR